MKRVPPPTQAQQIITHLLRLRLEVMVVVELKHPDTGNATPRRAGAAIPRNPWVSWMCSYPQCSHDPCSHANGSRAILLYYDFRLRAPA
jgi:hypothetical protein